MKIGYARVSTRDQNLDLQLDALKRAGCERIYQDVASGSKTARPALDELLGQVRAGDVLVVTICNRNGLDLQSSRFSTGIDCVYTSQQTGIICE
ncbi:recombinase family protein [Pseudomonas savastanoi]